MRVLSSYELDLIAGGLVSESVVDPNGDLSGGGLTGGRSSDHPLLSSGAIATVGWRDVMGDMGSFFSEMNSVVSHSGSDQNSYYDHGYDIAPWVFGFSSNFGWNESQRRALGMNYFDYLTNNIDPEFLITDYTSTGLSSEFSGGSATITPVNDDSFFIRVRTLISSVAYGVKAAISTTLTDS